MFADLCLQRALGNRDRNLRGQWGVQCVRGLKAQALWFHSLADRRISSPVSQCWAHAGLGKVSQENLCWCQQWKHRHPSTALNNICQTAVCRFVLIFSAFSFISLNISILTDVHFWNLKSVLARGFTLHMACCLCRNFGNAALYLSPQGWGSFEGAFKGVSHTCIFLSYGPGYVNVNENIKIITLFCIASLLFL